jgi:hypothetical protein
MSVKDLDFAELKRRNDFEREKRGTCVHCTHPIGYHWLDDQRCTCKDCECPGYEAAVYPDSKAL